MLKILTQDMIGGICDGRPWTPWVGSYFNNQMICNNNNMNGHWLIFILVKLYYKCNLSFHMVLCLSVLSLLSSMLTTVYQEIFHCILMVGAIP